jgi:hypothetical protein
MKIKNIVLFTFFIFSIKGMNAAELTIYNAIPQQSFGDSSTIMGDVFWYNSWHKKDMSKHFQLNKAYVAQATKESIEPSIHITTGGANPFMKQKFLHQQLC